MLVETMLDVKKAEKDQKLGTGAHGVITAGTWVFTFPLALKLMHHIGGMQYAGMSKEAVEEVKAEAKAEAPKAKKYAEKEVETEDERSHSGNKL